MSPGRGAGLLAGSSSTMPSAACHSLFTTHGGDHGVDVLVDGAAGGGRAAGDGAFFADEGWPFLHLPAWAGPAGMPGAAR